MNDLVSRSEIKKSARQMLTDENPTTIALLKMFDEIVDNTAPADNWIPVSDRLPEKNKAVLVYCHQHRNIYCAILIGNFWKIYGTAHILQEEVIAWMPLPEPYKESENETDN